jgi:hypothetical protein
MTKYLLIGLLTFQIGCTSDRSQYQEIIGNNYNSLHEFQQLKDFKEIGSSQIQDGDDFQYTLSIYKKDKFHVLVLERAKKNQSRYTALDVLELKGFEERNRIETLWCRQNKKNDSKIIALSKYEETEFLTKIVKAWRINIEKGKIEEMVTTGVDCINISYGND